MHFWSKSSQGNTIEQKIPKHAHEDSLARSNPGSYAVFTNRDTRSGRDSHYLMTKNDTGDKLKLTWDQSSVDKPNSDLADQLFKFSCDRDIRRGMIFRDQGTKTGYLKDGIRPKSEYTLVEPYDGLEAASLKAQYFEDAEKAPSTGGHSGIQDGFRIGGDPRMDSGVSLGVSVQGEGSG